VLGVFSSGGKPRSNFSACDRAKQRFRYNNYTGNGGTVIMAKYTATIDEDTRQRIHALPRGIHFSAFMRKAIAIFVEELEKHPDLTPENFIITHSAKKDTTDRKGK
jgi:hypothetical protein